MQTTLLDTNNRKLRELRLQKLREQSKEDDQMRSAEYQETLLDWKERGDSGNDNQENPLEMVLIASPDWSKWETGHVVEITEVVNEAGISAIAFD